MSSSGKQNDLGQPFGYLKASTTLTCVNLFVMPYNYPVLLPLLGKTCGIEGFSLKWPQNFWVIRSKLILNLKCFSYLGHVIIINLLPQASVVPNIITNNRFITEHWVIFYNVMQHTCIMG